MPSWMRLPRPGARCSRCSAWRCMPEIEMPASPRAAWMRSGARWGSGQPCRDGDIAACYGKDHSQHMKPKIILDPAFRRMHDILSEADLSRLHAAADVIWGKDEPMPEAQIENVREEIEAIVCGSW